MFVMYVAGLGMLGALLPETVVTACFHGSVFV